MCSVAAAASGRYRMIELDGAHALQMLRSVSEGWHAMEWRDLFHRSVDLYREGLMYRITLPPGARLAFEAIDPELDLYQLLLVVDGQKPLPLGITFEHESAPPPEQRYCSPVEQGSSPCPYAQTVHVHTLPPPSFRSPLVEAADYSNPSEPPSLSDMIVSIDEAQRLAFASLFV